MSYKSPKLQKYQLYPLKAQKCTIVGKIYEYSCLQGFLPDNFSLIRDNTAILKISALFVGHPVEAHLKHIYTKQWLMPMTG